MKHYQFGVIFIVIVGLISGWFGTTGSKSQWIRILDFTLIGPVMILLGLSAHSSPVALRIAVIYFGATTVTYNLRNYLVQNSK